SQIRLTFNNVPAGVTLTLTINTGSSRTDASLVPIFGADLGGACSGCAASTTITSASNTSTISFVATPNATGTSTSRAETIEVDYTIALTSTASISTPGTIS